MPLAVESRFMFHVRVPGFGSALTQARLELASALCLRLGVRLRAGLPGQRTRALHGPTALRWLLGGDTAHPGPSSQNLTYVGEAP